MFKKLTVLFFSTAILLYIFSCDFSDTILEGKYIQPVIVDNSIEWIAVPGVHVYLVPADFVESAHFLQNTSSADEDWIDDAINYSIADTITDDQGQFYIFDIPGGPYDLFYNYPDGYCNHPEHNSMYLNQGKGLNIGTGKLNEIDCTLHPVGPNGEDKIVHIELDGTYISFTIGETVTLHLAERSGDVYTPTEQLSEITAADEKDIYFYCNPGLEDNSENYNLFYVLSFNGTEFGFEMDYGEDRKSYGFYKYLYGGDL
ncbi:hypothetical protein [Spirochaeta isovalerica]|uniref:Uncharacterized protein n=1 Tax=Spirochaeta isovalerica TaxID=150 RepID=A0A841RCM2_9SPIO|nr:hypothetical protein [Spirochaeta isovalerica]MBB6480740.1 hypothetical protein [Spirochaeta isovalerica]